MIDNRCNGIRISIIKVREKIKSILKFLDATDSEISISFVDNREIEELNRRYLGRSGPTNVIAFPMREGEYANINRRLLGDVVISVETAEKEGKTGSITTEDRLNELLVHGILHLFGYDRQKAESDALKMEHKATELLKIIHGAS